MDPLNPAQPDAKSPAAWAQVWQLPVLAIGLALLGGGLYLAKPRLVPPDYHGTLDTVQQYLRAGNPEEARVRMDLLVEEKLAEQDDDIRGRYYQYLGDHDWLVYDDLYPVPADTSESRAQLNKVVDAYRQADEEFDRDLDSEAMQRWAMALVHLGQEDQALQIVDRMGPSDADKRYRLIRQLIEAHRDRGDPEGVRRHARSI